MGSKWNNGSRDIGGILRKSNPPPVAENEARGGDLLVFGYACKVFRDDEKALLIDKGKQLIPWMGDDGLKIDRYDVRAALSDLSQYEPPPGGYTNRLDYLTPAEQRAEQLCEEERYYSLYHSEEDEQMYQEEVLKRLHQEGSKSYGQVQFNYNNPKTVQDSNGNGIEKVEETDEVFIPPQNFVIPDTLTTPDTQKQHAIIEKTAKFISKQGPQMEILIKAKQSNNPQFEFLNQNNRLNAYYKFVLNAFKDNTYPEQAIEIEGEGNAPTEVEEATKKDNTNMLVPQSVFVHPAAPISIPTIKYKPSADCAYTQLISKIKGVPIPQEEPDDTDKNELAESSPSLYYSTLYSLNRLDQGVFNNSTTNSSATAQQQQLPQTTSTGHGVEIKKISSGLMMAQCYASDTEDENDADDSAPIIPENFSIPPESLKNIIDKTAIYVAKNGRQFEDILQTKQDERFTFLDPSDEYYPYYLQMVLNLNSNYIPCSNRHDNHKYISPVSFSIKSREESSVSVLPALLQETSDDDDAENKVRTGSSTSQQAQHAQVPDKPPSANAALAAATAARISAAIAAANSGKNSSQTSSAKSRFDIDNTGAIVNRTNPIPSNAAPDGNKCETSQQKELKRAEEKVKDRLAQIAREKLGLISKEKQLQLERKKRAMAFLHQIKSSGVTHSKSSSTTPQQNNITNNNSTRTESEETSDSDVSSVHSIPIKSQQGEDMDENNIAKDKEVKIHSKSIEYPNQQRQSRTPTIHNYNANDYVDNSDDDCRIIEDEKDSVKHNSRKVSDSRRKRHRSRSCSKGSSSRHRHKKKKSKHSKKKSKKRSRSRSTSLPLPTSHNASRNHKRTAKQPTDSRKAKKKRRRERGEE